MAMTNERANLLATYLSADEARTKILFGMTADEAVAKINADGYDFTADELREFGTKLVNTATVGADDDELSEGALENVAGGLVGAFFMCCTIWASCNVALAWLKR